MSCSVCSWPVGGGDLTGLRVATQCSHLRIRADLFFSRHTHTHTDAQTPASATQRCNVAVRYGCDQGAGSTHDPQLPQSTAFARPQRARSLSVCVFVVCVSDLKVIVLSWVGSKGNQRAALKQLPLRVPQVLHIPIIPTSARSVADAELVGKALAVHDALQAQGRCFSCPTAGRRTKHLLAQLSQYPHSGQLTEQFSAA